MLRLDMFHKQTWATVKIKLRMLLVLSSHENLVPQKLDQTR